MSIKNVIIHVADVDRAVDFYTRHFGGVVVGDATETGALVDFVTATIEFVKLDSGSPSTWQDDDTVRGFRHVGFKVAAVDPIVAGLKAEGVRFRLEAHDVDIAGVRIVFFYDPDGTVLELVERHLTYHEVHDEAGVADELTMPTPERPRFDHVGHTVKSLQGVVDFYRPLGYSNLGAIFFNDERGFRIDYLRAGQSVIEVFTYDVQTTENPVRLDTYGFVAIELEGDAPASSRGVGSMADGRTVRADPDDLGFRALGG